MTPTSYLLFDLDGTLSDPLEGIGNAINYALSSLGYETRSSENLGQFIGPPLDQTFKQLTASGDQEHLLALVKEFRVYFGGKGYAENHLYQGIPEILDAFHRQGVSMGVCTVKREDFARKIIRMFRLDAYFDFISGGNIGMTKGTQIARLLEKRQISSGSIMIGDREGDIRAARENGLRSAGVLWGYGSREELTAASPDRLFESPADLAVLTKDIQEGS